MDQIFCTEATRTLVAPPLPFYLIRLLLISLISLPILQPICGGSPDCSLKLSFSLLSSLLPGKTDSLLATGFCFTNLINTLFCCIGVISHVVLEVSCPCHLQTIYPVPILSNCFQDKIIIYLHWSIMARMLHLARSLCN